MQAILLLMRGLFAALVLSVNKTFEKSQRGTFEFRLPGSSAFYAQPFDDATIQDLRDVTTGNTISEEIAAMARGDGLYTVNLTVADSANGNTGIKMFANSVGSGSTIVVKVSGTDVTIISATASNAKTVNLATSIASNDATSKADSAKQQAINAAADDATSKANAAKDAAISTAASDASSKADSARNSAVSTAASDASSKANAAKDAAISAAALDATSKANAAKEAAALDATSKANSVKDAAALDATSKANAAKTEAVGSSKVYTDAEIAKLQLLAKKGWGYRRTERLLDTSIMIDDKGSVGTLASATAFGMSAGEYYVLEVELRDEAGQIIYGKEGRLTVATGEFGSHDTAITTEIIVSTEDELFVECIALTRVNEEGVSVSYPFLKYIKKHDVRILEMYNELMVKINDQVSETELLAAMEEMKAYVDEQINPALK